MAANAIERAAAAQLRIEELLGRLQVVERRVVELTRETTQDTIDGDELRRRLERIDQRLTDLGREVGTKLGELGAPRERLTRIESAGRRDQQGADRARRRSRRACATGWRASRRG